MPQSIERKEIEEKEKCAVFIKKIKTFSFFFCYLKFESKNKKKINHSYLMCSFPFLSNRINDFSLFPMNKHKNQK